MKTLFRTEEERKVVLSDLEEKEILAVDPSFQSIAKAIYFDNYDLPCPIMVEILKMDGLLNRVVLRKARHGDVQKEVAVLKVLREYGLPVPEVLSEPFENENKEQCAIYSFLSGENLQKLSSESEEGLERAKRLLVEAVQKLASAGEYISQHHVLKNLPRISLVQELQNIRQDENKWLKDSLYVSVVEFLNPKLEVVTTPLILSNGDYQPGNFMTENGRITGFLDFESPSFQDPMMGFVKYPIYDLRPLSRTDLIDYFLETMRFTRQEFSLRLILGCLKILKKEIPLNGGDTEMEEYRNRVLGILKEEMRVSL